MDPIRDVALLWIASDALHASVPEPWIEGLDMRGRLYYYNTVTGNTTWDKPAGFDEDKPTGFGEW